MENNKKTVESLAQALETNVEIGLTNKQVQERLARYGFNAAKKNIGRSFLQIFLSQFNDPLIYLLLSSGVIIFFAGAQFDAYIIAGILLLNAIIGSLQDVRIAVVMENLQNFGQANCVVLREGIRRLVKVDLLVPGDIIILQEGEKIPADATIVKAYGLSTDESLLTGESNAIAKTEMQEVLSGSYILSGYGTAMVTATGQNTRMGQIHQTMETVSTDMPLQKDLSHLLKFILIVIVFICFSLLAIGVATGKPFGQLLAALTALFICVLPQGLPVIMTVVLVSGAYAMARKKVFAKRLQAVEALGRADVIIMDKTGTLTRNELMVSFVQSGGTLFEVSGSGYLPKGQVKSGGDIITECSAPEELKLMAQAALLLDRSEVDITAGANKTALKGRPVQAAMALFGHKLGFEKTQVVTDYNLFFEIPFSSELRYHAGFFEKDGQGVMFGLGAPEVIMNRCKDVSEEQKQALNELLDKGLRVIAVCSKPFNKSELKDYSKIEFENLFNDLSLLGFFGLSDTLRSEAPDIVQSLQKAGMKIVMATGDNSQTAVQLAKQAGIMQQGDTDISGAELRESSDEAISKKLETVSVFSQVSPEEKLRIVNLFQQRGDIVAMIGDGANDAPALAVAQLGIAMGNVGSDIAKEAADIILIDDSFESITAGVEQGRHIFASFKRVILYFFTTNFSEIGIMLFAFAGNFPLPLLASQILWLNLITDGLLDFSLAMEPQQGGLLKRRLLAGQRMLISNNLIARIVYQAGVVTLISSIFFYTYYKTDLALARTLVMVVMTTCYWFIALNCRSFNRSVTQIGLVSNRWIAVSLAMIPVLLLGILYTSWGNLIFQTVPLSWEHWSLIIPIGCYLLIVEELRKRFIRGN